MESVEHLERFMCILDEQPLKFSTHAVQERLLVCMVEEQSVSARMPDWTKKFGTRFAGDVCTLVHRSSERGDKVSRRLMPQGPGGFFKVQGNIIFGYFKFPGCSHRIHRNKQWPCSFSLFLFPAPS